MTGLLRVGHIDLSFHRAAALRVEEILEAHGHSIERRAAPHEEMFRIMDRGEVDFLVSAWLPESHGAYLAPFEGAVDKVTVLYEPYCIWGVPDYVPASIGSIPDLLSEPALARMERLVQGINPGAGISRFSKAIIEQYGLGAASYSFRTGSEDECFSRFELAVAEERWVIVPLWHPQWLHARYRIRALGDPKGLLGGTDNATLLLRKDARSRVAPAALAALAELHLGNAEVSRLDDILRTQGAPE
jgi:glycine betaine/proline transport system substrate-binding protein